MDVMELPSMEKQLTCCGSTGARALGRAREGGRDGSAPLASSAVAEVFPLDLLDFRCRDQELVVGEPGGLEVPGREGPEDKLEGVCLTRFGSDSFTLPPPEGRARLGALVVL